MARFYRIAGGESAISIGGRRLGSFVSRTGFHPLVNPPTIERRFDIGGQKRVIGEAGAYHKAAVTHFCRLARLGRPQRQHLTVPP